MAAGLFMAKYTPGSITEAATIAIVGADVVTVAQTVSSWGFAITPEALQAVAHDIATQPAVAIRLAVQDSVRLSAGTKEPSKS